MKSAEYKKNLLNFLDKIKDVDGDILEVGSYKGDTTEILCDFVKSNNLNKKVYTIDTFTGYIEEDLKEALPKAKQHFNNGVWKHSKISLEKRLEKYSDMVTVWEGDSKVVLPKHIENGDLSKISLLYVDCNLYPPSIKAIEDIYPLIPLKGVITIDEHWLDKYGKYGGESKALFELAEKINNEPIHYSIKSGPSYYIIKK